MYGIRSLRKLGGLFKLWEFTWVLRLYKINWGLQKK